MAKKSAIEKNEKRKRMVENKRETRDALRALIKRKDISDAERWEAGLKLQKMPRDSSPSRVQTRCQLTGRPHSVYRKFGLCRNQLRELASEGLIPGVTKSSW